jgi:hypothetical protein
MASAASTVVISGAYADWLRTLPQLKVFRSVVIPLTVDVVYILAFP